MNKDDLTQVKNIGPARKNILASHGITTVQQLYDIPLEKLMQIKSLGQHNAKLIKAAVNDLYTQKKVAPAVTVSDGPREKKEKYTALDRKLKSELGKTTKYLKRAKEKFKPIKKKKHLKLFVEFKTQSNNLKARILVLRRQQQDILKKQKKKITKKAAALNSSLKNAGKKKKGKTMKMLSKEIESFLNLLDT
jgi:DNA-directed RNA polymerase alpha subunit